MRDAVPELLRPFGIDVVCTATDDADVRAACARNRPAGVAVELNVEWDVAQLVGDLRAQHPAMRIIGIAAGDARAERPDVDTAATAGPQTVRTDAEVDARVEAIAEPFAVAAALRGDVTRPPARSVTASPLTARQTQILHLASQGRSAEQIASALQLSTSTVAYHKRQIFSRLGVQSQAQAVADALQRGLLVES